MADRTLRCLHRAPINEKLASTMEVPQSHALQPKGDDVADGGSQSSLATPPCPSATHHAHQLSRCLRLQNGTLTNGFQPETDRRPLPLFAYE